MKYVVASADEIPPGGRKILDVAGRSIGVFNVDGEYFALRNRCPHQGGPLCEGTLWGILKADVPGSFNYEASKEILTCPWHGWEFHVRTGQSWCDPRRLRVRRYDVSLAEGTVLTAEPRAAHDLARAAVLELAHPAWSQKPERFALAQRTALVRAAVEYGEELTADVEHAHRAAANVDDLAFARWNLVDGGDDVLHRL